MEIWKPVPGWEGRYEASTLGRVRGVDRTTVTKKGVIKRTQGLVLHAHPNTAGYLCLRLGRGNPVMVHQVIALTFIGPRPDGAYICHGDGNKLNNVPSNLRYDTPKANQQDRLLHGTEYRGEKTKAAKLTADQARWIRENYGSETNTKVAARFGVSPAAVYLIGKGRNWKHVGVAA